MNAEPIVPLEPRTLSEAAAPLPAAAILQGPWDDPAQPGEPIWEPLVQFDNFWQGNVTGGLLESEGIPVLVEIQWPQPDLTSRSTVWVRREQVRRARWILSWSAPTEEELVFLATESKEIP